MNNNIDININSRFSSEKQYKSRTICAPSVLKDLKQSGKERPWKKNKLLSVAISDAYSSLSELKQYGTVIAACGNYLKFGSCAIVEHGKKLIEAYFCKARLCVMCQWRKSLVIRKQALSFGCGERKGAFY